MVRMRDERGEVMSINAINAIGADRRTQLPRWLDSEGSRRRRDEFGDERGKCDRCCFGEDVYRQWLRDDRHLWHDQRSAQMTKDTVCAALPKRHLFGHHIAVTRHCGYILIIGNNAFHRGDRNHRCRQGHDCCQRTRCRQPANHPNQHKFSEKFHTHIETSLAWFGSPVTQLSQSEDFCEGNTSIQGHRSPIACANTRQIQGLCYHAA